MRNLLIAPINPDIADIATAVQAICSLHPCELIQASDTTHREIIDKAKIGGYSTLWLFGVASGGGGLALPNHQELTIEQVISVVQISEARLAILFVCNSWPMAQAVLERTRADVIFTMDTILGPDAVWSATILARWLQSHPAKDAFKSAQLGEKFFYSENYSRRIIDAMNTDPQTSSQLDRLYVMLEGLRREVSGVDRSVAALQASMVAISSRLDRIEQNGKSNKPTMTQMSISQLIFVVLIGITTIITAGVMFTQGIR